MPDEPEDREERRQRKRREERDHERGGPAPTEPPVLLLNPDPDHSVIDDVEPADARGRIAEAFGGDAEEARRRSRMRLTGAFLSAMGILLIWLALQAQGGQGQVGTPGAPTGAPATQAPATQAPATQPPLTQASPQVNAAGTATATLVKVSGPCRFAARFTDRYSFAASSGALTVTQLSNNHVTTGRIETSGEFTTMAAGQGYRGRITGTTAQGEHTYTADGCNEVYSFTMQFPAPPLSVANAPSPTAARTATPTPAATATAPPATPTATVATAAGAAINVPLAGAGALLTLGGLAVAFGGGKRLSGLYQPTPAAQPDQAALEARARELDRLADDAERHVREQEVRVARAEEERRRWIAQQDIYDEGGHLELLSAPDPQVDREVEELSRLRQEAAAARSAANAALDAAQGPSVLDELGER